MSAKPSTMDRFIGIKPAHGESVVCAPCRICNRGDKSNGIFKSTDFKLPSEIHDSQKYIHLEVAGDEDRELAKRLGLTVSPFCTIGKRIVRCAGFLLYH